jgi:uroporphyrinogen-III synthase
MARVLVLRPEPGASATVDKARALGLDAVATPLFEVEPLEWRAPDPGSFDGLLLTSANAVRCGGEELRGLRALPVYAVGDATADAARDAGFDIAATGEAGIDRLLGSIESDLRLLHLCGEERRAPEQPRQEIEQIPVYRSKPLPHPDLSGAGGSVALIHSPRAGQRFAELVRERASIAIAAISGAAADAVGDGWSRIDVAEQPSDEALLALAARLCNKPDPE